MRQPRIFVAGSALLGLTVAGCSGWSYDPPMRGHAPTEGINLSSLRDEAPQAPEGFKRDLATGYADLAGSLKSEHQWDDVDYFSRKGLAAAGGGKAVPPEDNANWLVPLEVPDQYRSQLADGRRRLVAALDGGARQSAPDTAAHAQVSYDCWVEHMEVNWWQAINGSCHGQFVAALAQLEKPVAEVPSKPLVQAPAAEPAASGTSTRQFRVYFDFNKSVLTPTSQSILQQVVARAKEAPASKFALIGRADKTGADGYNMALSQRRVDAVRDSLMAQGVDPARIDTQWVGEREPPVPTANGVKEPRNRVVDVTEEQP
jgi:OmpA-OmpF porin, OOP family